jgi:fructose-specific phosphotransferase system IIC component
MSVHPVLKSFILVPVLALGLAGCVETRGERAAVGAVGGAVVADALGGSAVTGAVVGGAAGYFCDQLNVPGCKHR